LTLVEFYSLAAVIIAFLSFAFTQWRANRQIQEKEERIEIKLTIFYALRNDELTESELIDRINKARPTMPVSDVVIRKCLYEMLAENTVDYSEEGKWAAGVSVKDD